MPSPLRRNLAIAACLLIALLFGVLAARTAPPRPAARAETLANLPALPSDAPVLAETPVVAPADARARNAAVPFFVGKLTPAVPFRFAGSDEDRTRAADCLVLAALAEAGASDAGQRAVIQVVLNRVRHPAFARTVCGVVFEGAARATGCQFSFTCDGALARRYPQPQRDSARQRAEQALGGAVFGPVGNATHYHTDWVYPWWSPALVKLAQVETHLFYRWPGYWGTPAAMRIAYRGGEPTISGLSGPAPELAEALVPAAPLPRDTPKVTGGAVAMRDPTGRGNFVLLGSGTDAAGALALAHQLCPGTGTCRVLAWSERGAIPAKFPLPPAARAALRFSYSRDPGGSEITLYDCHAFAGLPRERCIPRAR